MNYFRRIVQPGVTRLTLLVAAALFVLGGAFAPQPATAQWDRSALQKALLATVHVVVPIEGEDGVYSTGSGTVLDAERGLILTNFHVMADVEGNGDLYNEEGVAIIGLLPDNLRGAPVYKYVAELVKGTEEWDLAVLRVVGLLGDTEAALPANLGLVAIDRGDSEELLPGDRLAVVGFPGLGGSSITFTEGVVAGFLDEDEDGVYEWIKTDTEINQGNSGGLTVNNDGDFVGVPTMFRFNEDGGGKLSLVRPGAIALDFYDSAALSQGGDKQDRIDRLDRTAPPADGATAIANVEFGAAVNNRNRVTEAATSFPSGINDLYVSYDYTGFARNKTFAYQWYLDGAPVYDDSFNWNGEPSGVDWLNLHSDRGLPDGAIEVEITFDGQSIYRGGVTIGAPPQPPSSSPGFGPISFAADVSDDGLPIDAGNAFVDVDVIYAFFDVTAVADGAPWTTRWLYNDEEVLREEAEWDQGDVAATWVSLSHPDGLPEGKFTLELYLDGDLSQSANFTIAARGKPQGNDAINVVGEVKDADNSRRKVSGAMIVFLAPGVATQDWIDADFDESMIHASGTSDRNGKFQLDAKVAPGEHYGVIVVQDDYKPIQVDDYEIPADSTDPYELDVTMERR